MEFSGLKKIMRAEDGKQEINLEWPNYRGMQGARFITDYPVNFEGEIFEDIYRLV